jgi:hypothetical protein
MKYHAFTPELAPSDYNSVPAMKQSVRRHKFEDDRLVKTVVPR